MQPFARRQTALFFSLFIIRPGRLLQRVDTGRGSREAAVCMGTFRATMYLELRSRARYTLPNFPCPRGRPMSKSASCQRRSLLAVLAAPLDAALASGSAALPYAGSHLGIIAHQQVQTKQYQRHQAS